MVQLSINALKPMEDHVDLGAKLASLRAQGVLILSSGNVVHNLRRVQWNRPDHGEDWAHRFDEAAVDLMAEAPSDILRLREHPDYDLAVPTPDHFIPLLFTAGLAAAEGVGAKPWITGYSLGSLSMTSYGLGIDDLPCAEGKDAAGVPSEVPADETNT